jgi:predicted nucleic acid binding AN1-type Zn finger protein
MRRPGIATEPCAPNNATQRREQSMADEADLAFDSEQRHLSTALAAQRSRSAALRPAGSCHYCGNDDGLAERLFCDSDCAADWEYEDALRRKLGLPAGQTLAH